MHDQGKKMKLETRFIHKTGPQTWSYSITIRDMILTKDVEVTLHHKGRTWFGKVPTAAIRSKNLHVACDGDGVPLLYNRKNRVRTKYGCYFKEATPVKKAG